MGLRQTFQFDGDRADVVDFLRSLSTAANVDDRGDFFVFSNRSGDSFRFDCAIVPGGLLSDRAGDYFWFLGLFVEALTGRFGKVEIDDD